MCHKAEIISELDGFTTDGLALTIGFFDGVHKGHKYLISHLCDIAHNEGIQSSILTFWPHPRTVLHESYQPKLLNTIEEKDELIHSLPIDYCFQIPFTKELSSYSAYDFMGKILHDKLKVKHLVIGYDHHFGHNCTETFEDYCKYGKQLNMEVTKAPIFSPNGNHVSSSVIRRLIDEGNVSKANEYLDYNYSITGVVEHGKKIGSKIGFPTANIHPISPNKIIPGEGVYAVRVLWYGHTYMGMACIGTRPTFEEKGTQSIEVHIFDFGNDLYGEQLHIEFVDYIRPQKKFASKEELTIALNNDKKATLKRLGEKEI